MSCRLAPLRSVGTDNSDESRENRVSRKPARAKASAFRRSSFLALRGGDQRPLRRSAGGAPLPIAGLTANTISQSLNADSDVVENVATFG